jgi:hypothetical protein
MAERPNPKIVTVNFKNTIDLFSVSCQAVIASFKYMETAKLFALA